MKVQIDDAVQKYVTQPLTCNGSGRCSECARKDFVAGAEYVASLNVMPLYEALQKIIDLYPPTEEWAIRRHNDIREVAYKVLSLPLPESAGVWVKAGIGSLPEKHKEVIVRNIKNGKVKKTKCMGNYIGWDIAMDRDFFYDDTEWLDESGASLSNKEDEWIPISEYKIPIFDGISKYHWVSDGDNVFLAYTVIHREIWYSTAGDIIPPNFKPTHIIPHKKPQPPKNK